MSVFVGHALFETSITMNPKLPRQISGLKKAQHRGNNDLQYYMRQSIQEWTQ